jgi:hypothetical protein
MASRSHRADILSSLVVAGGLLVTVAAVTLTLALAAYGEPAWVAPAKTWLSAQPFVRPT